MNKKGQGISINMLIIIALAVFTVFLVLGFMSGGWSYFAGAFKGVAGGSGSGMETAKVKCDRWCVTYKNDDCRSGTTIHTKLTTMQLFGYDTNGDGNSTNDCFQCTGGTPDCGPDGEEIGNVIGGCSCG